MRQKYMQVEEKEIQRCVEKVTESIKKLLDFRKEDVARSIRDQKDYLNAAGRDMEISIDQSGFKLSVLATYDPINGEILFPGCEKHTPVILTEIRIRVCGALMDTMGGNT